MPTLTLKLKYDIAHGLVISPSAFITEYLHGIPLIDMNGNSYSVKNIINKILDATTVSENFLKIKISYQILDEQQDYILEEFGNWGHIKLEYRIIDLIDDVKGYINDYNVVTIDKTMWTIKGKMLAFVPGMNIASSNIILGQSGSFPLLRGGQRIVPNFWHIRYSTGLTEVPRDILQFICKLASIQILAILGDIQLGIGITSKSISFDGLSESLSTSRSGTTSLFGARIKQYTDEITNMNLSLLKDTYRGILFETM